MPREFKDPIRDRKLEAQIPNATGFQVAANPVDTTVLPSRNNNALKLADALSGVNTKLAPIVEAKLKEAEDHEKQRGMLHQLQGNELPKDATQNFMDGYLQLQWDDFGRQAKVSLATPVLTNIVHKKNTKSIRWLKRMGFQFLDAPVPAYPDFIQFVRYSNV